MTPSQSHAGWAPPIDEAVTEQLVHPSYGNGASELPNDSGAVDQPAVAEAADAGGDATASVAAVHRSADGSLLYPSLATSIAGGLVAIAVILASILGINLLLRDKNKTSPLAKIPASRASAAKGSSSPGTAASKTGAGTPTPTKSSTTLQSAKPVPQPAAKPATKPSTKSAPSATVNPTSSADPSATQQASPPAVVTRIPITVLNSSRIHGLAASAVGDFKAAAWPVAEIGNTSYRVKITTVYYLPGQETLAEELMRDVPGVRRMLPRPLALPGKGLTVVVTREYAA
ncbi:MAG: LytR C-terminal domain-containing protein [Actinomycetota bacterium]